VKWAKKWVSESCTGLMQLISLVHIERACSVTFPLCAVKVTLRIDAEQKQPELWRRKRDMLSAIHRTSVAVATRCLLRSAPVRDDRPDVSSGASFRSGSLSYGGEIRGDVQGREGETVCVDKKIFLFGPAVYNCRHHCTGRPAVHRHHEFPVTAGTLPR